MELHSISSTIAAGSNNGLTIPDAVYSVLCSWWWVEEPPETCRAIYRNKWIEKTLLLVGCTLEIYCDAGTYERQKFCLLVRLVSHIMKVAFHSSLFLHCILEVPVLFLIVCGKINFFWIDLSEVVRQLCFVIVDSGFFHVSFHAAVVTLL